MVSINWCCKQKDGIKLVEPNDNLTKGYMKMAENSLGTMNREKQYNLMFAISACYYSMYYSLYAICMKIGIKCEIHLDTTSNIIGNPEIKKQIEDQLRDQFERNLPEVTKRMSEIPALLTADVGFYSKLLDEAKNCYLSGLFHASISMIGIASERFVIELFEKMKFKLNDKEISGKDLFDRPIQKHQWKLNLLNKSKLLKSEYVKKLEEINTVRNKYIHPRELGDAKEDSLKVLKLYIEILNSRFSDDYTINNGKIVKKNS